MKRTELNKFIKAGIIEQGSSGSVNLGPLTVELLKHTPSVVHIGNKRSGSDSKTTLYDVIDDQEEIDAIIDAAVGSEVSQVCVHDAGTSIHFAHVELSDDILTGLLHSYKGTFQLFLSKEKGQSQLVFTED